jgi:transcription initiation factor TFIIE subunit alpha
MFFSLHALIQQFSHTRPEVKEGQQRPVNRTYYYIDYRATIDAIKWRVYLIDKKVQGNTIAEVDRKEYFCPRCKAEWTQMEVLDKVGPEGFLCHKCGFLLNHDPDNNRGGHEQSTKLNAQFRFITDLLPKIDEVVIPENTFDQAFNSARKVIRDESNPANQTAPLVASVAKPTAVSGMKQQGPTSIAITLTASEGPTEADLAAEQIRKQKIATQNAMPVHFTHSTISGEQVKFTGQPSTSFLSQSTDEKKDIALDTSSVNGDSAEIDDYFARLKAEQAKEAEQEQEEEYETDDEEEEDFEDVVPTGTGSGAGTPASSIGDHSKPTSAPSGSGLSGLTSALKKGGSVSGSGTSTGVTSPVTGPGTPVEDGRPAKKVRIEEPEPEPSIKAEEEESEEDMEFEDV